MQLRKLLQDMLHENEGVNQVGEDLKHMKEGKEISRAKIGADSSVRQHN